MWIADGWNHTKLWLDTTLYEMGHKVHLGHEGHPCPNTLAEKKEKSRVFKRWDGEHTVLMVNCNCRRLAVEAAQVIRPLRAFCSDG